jgi:hypothetical protein
MTVSVSLSVNPGSPAAGAVVTAQYAVSGASPGTAQTLSFSGTATLGGVSYPGATGSFTLPGTAPAESFAVPTCPGLTFAKTAQANTFTATVPAPGTVSGPQTVSGSATVGGGSPMKASASVTLPAAPVTPPVTPPAGTVAPYPAALATGHALLEQYLPADLYAWRYLPGTTTAVTNGSGVSEDPNSPRNVSVTTDGDVPVLRLATTSASDCGVIQSPGTYPTSSGVVEALVKFSGITVDGARVFGDWASLWMYGAQWPQMGELDAVETQYGNSFISYHYGTGSSSNATTDPWTYASKTVQLSPKNSTAAPVAPNIVPDEWTYVTMAFGKNAAGNYQCEVFYNGVLYCTVAGAYVTGDSMYLTAGTGFGAATLGSSQAPYDQPGTLEIQYVRVFS